MDAPEELVNAVHESGLVGLGGAGFPAYVKLKVPKDKRLDTLIVNVAECEPYITADNREAIENSWAVLSGVYAIKDLLKLDRVIIAVENNKPEVIETLRKIAESEERDPENRDSRIAAESELPPGRGKGTGKSMHQPRDSAGQAACRRRLSGYERDVGGLPGQTT